MRNIGGHVSIAGGLGNAIQNSLNIDGNCLQIFAGSPRLWSRQLWKKEDVTNFLSQVLQHDLNPVFIHALYLVNLGTDSPDLLAKSTAALTQDIQNGDQINSAGVIVHIGSHQGRGFETVSQQIVDTLKQILKATNKTPLLLETDAGQNGKIGSLEEISFLIKSVDDPRLGVCFDTAHLFESGLDLRDKSKLLDFIAELKKLEILDKVVCIHLNDSATDLDSHRDNHADLGKGKIGLEGLSNFVNLPEFIHLPLILETPGPNREGPDAKNISIARELSI